ncbi:MAG TPA: methionine adenosyltransferase [Bacilli bacterium]|jgi:S-adenosylmethionine synthetase|nr:methionine adenosyltransferase [Erysipelotrichaceae bacterium]HOA11210.1 methionine adenosyltransferase [Bacilli bacterium]HOH94561.1 methionine adenosyltransferase [Bacilli bacterium]HOM32115.1 methionine adenosyltransferase [Bacilli bacterium]HQB96534.1 methionine adenosyltransferase [Bacilli bacterium]
MANYRLFTSESVSEGHPDKVCDQISDAILDAVLAINPNARVACEVFATTNFVLISGETSLTKEEEPDYENIAREVIRDIGYTNPKLGFSADAAEIVIKMNQQSSDIAQGVTQIKPEEQGAGDQGIMFGYATKESAGLMPLAIVIAHKLMRVATKMRKDGEFPGARPDMKSQVTMRYYEDGSSAIDTVLMSVQHDEDVNLEEFKKFIHQKIMIPVVESFGKNTDFKYLVNPTGRFVIGGPAGDTGLTGRKIIVDTYGGYAKHGGGAFSGKDPSKVDRSAAYYARYIAKNLVESDVCDEVEIQLSYAIGVAEPLSVAIDTFGTGKVADEVILAAISKYFDCRPGMITQEFSLRKPKFKYRDLAALGHFGRPDINIPWEETNKAQALKSYFKKYLV